MKTMTELFWKVVDELREGASPLDMLNNPTAAINSPTHVLRIRAHFLNNPANPLNNPMAPGVGKKRAAKLAELLTEFIVD